MAEANCRRELDLEIPATEVQKAIERVAREFARVARTPRGDEVAHYCFVIVHYSPLDW